MKIILSKTYDPVFVYYLRDYVKDICLSSVNKIKLNKLNSEFNENFYDIIVYSLDNFEVNESVSKFTLEFDYDKQYDDKPLDYWINVLTYGDRKCQGYPIINNVFNFAIEHIDFIYEEWKDER